MAKQNAIGGFVYTEGSNANGVWRRMGTRQECWGTVTLTFTSVSLLSTSWTFPVAFKAATVPRVFPALQDNLANAAPSFQELSTMFANQAAISNTAATIGLARIIGLTNFASGNTAIAVVYAFGEAP